ncbi:MAG: GNAT family N-acetyltransferase [Actinomycetota bacterium]|nr:GNAT family N-acetyltransferase [Actinomycetota bacterium]
MVPVTELAETIRTARLTLPLVTPQDAADMRAGRRSADWHPDYPRKDDLDAAAMVGSKDAWGPRHVVRSFDMLVVGSIGFFGPPDPAPDGVLETEVGYGLVEDARGHGAATEALRALLGETDHLGVRIRASVLPENAASIRVLAKCGFTEVRGSSPDGELVLVRPLPRG